MSTGTNAIEKAKPPVEVTDLGVRFETIESLFRFAEAVHRSALSPRSLDTPEKILVAIETGLELGLRPMQALRGIYVVNGRPGMMVELAAGVVRNSGKAASLKMGVSGEGENRHGWCESKRDGETLKTTFSVADAKKAGLWGGGTWAKYPDRMLQARASGFHFRDYYSDVLMGLATTEELADIQEAPRRVVATEIATSTPDPLADAILEPAKPRPKRKKAEAQDDEMPPLREEGTPESAQEPQDDPGPTQYAEPVQSAAELLEEADKAIKGLWPSSKLMRDKAARILFEVESHALEKATDAHLITGVARLRKYIDSIGEGKPALTPAELEGDLIPF